MTTSKENVVPEGNSDEDMDAHAYGNKILDLIGFEIEDASELGVHGRFTVGDYSIQPFRVLHGGMTAYISEAVASLGAQVAANFQRVAGIELNINHLRAVPAGYEVKVDAVPTMVGNRIQVWEVKFSTNQLVDKRKSFNSSDAVKPEALLVAIARLTLIVGLPLSPTQSIENTVTVTPSAKL